MRLKERPSPKQKSRATLVTFMAVTSATRPTSVPLYVFPPPPPPTSLADSGVSVVDEVPSAFRPQVTLGLAFRFNAGLWHKKKSHKCLQLHLC